MSALSVLWILVGSAAIVVGTGVVFALVYRLIRTVARHAGVTKATLGGIQEGLELLWLAVAASAVLAYSGLASLFTVLTITGIAGLVVSLALQTTLSNMVAGLLLLSDRLIRVGDIIEYPGVKGRIVRVALRNTWIMTENGDVVVVGNSTLHGGPLVNHSARARFSAEFGP